MLAIETLSWMSMQRLSERLALAKTIKQLDVHDPNTIKLAGKLVRETLQCQNLLDRYINNVLKPKKLGEFNLGVQSFLRLYVNQTRATKGWGSVDVEEAKKIVKLGRSILGWKTMQGVEQVLGLLLTNEPNRLFQDIDDEERIGLRTFHPTWFARYCVRIFGRKDAIAILEGNQTSPPTYMRINTLKASEISILERLSRDGIAVEKVEELAHVYKVKNTVKPLTQTSCFKEGLLYVQDKASCFAVQASAPKPGMTVLDVCAAPGAKTTHLAQLMQNEGDIYSVDYSKRRIMTWKQEVSRLGVEMAFPVIADTRMKIPLSIEADVTILDPPCTGTGVFWRSASAKWRLTPLSVERMANIQWRMINSIAENVKPGGDLIYSTCSITVEENEMIVERFLKWHTDFSLSDITPDIGSLGLRGLEACRRLYPLVHDCNGFFIAKLSKIKN